MSTRRTTYQVPSDSVRGTNSKPMNLLDVTEVDVVSLDDVFSDVYKDDIEYIRTLSPRASTSNRSTPTTTRVSPRTSPRASTSNRSTTRVSPRTTTRVSPRANGSSNVNSYRYSPKTKDVDLESYEALGITSSPRLNNRRKKTRSRINGDSLKNLRDRFEIVSNQIDEASFINEDILNMSVGQLIEEFNAGRLDNVSMSVMEGIKEIIATDPLRRWLLQNFNI